MSFQGTARLPMGMGDSAFLFPKKRGGNGKELTKKLNMLIVFFWREVQDEVQELQHPIGFTNPRYHTYTLLWTMGHHLRGE